MFILDKADTLLQPDPKGVTVTRASQADYEVTGGRSARPFVVWGFCDDDDPSGNKLFVAFCDCSKGVRHQRCGHAVGVLKYMVANGGATWSEIKAKPAATRPSYFTARETSEVLGLPKAEIASLVRSGKLSPFQVTGRKGRFVVYDFNEVSELIIPNLNRS
jgi:hypothetical protein